MRVMLEACRSGAGSDARFTWVDEKFLEERGVEAWKDIPVWVPRRSEEGGLSQVGIERAVTNGLTFRPTEATVRDILAWWTSLPAARREKMRAGIAAQREAELLAAWKSLGG
jgi:2'-hydroxyisoflavone reductase